MDFETARAKKEIGKAIKGYYDTKGSNADEVIVFCDKNGNAHHAYEMSYEFSFVIHHHLKRYQNDEAAFLQDFCELTGQEDLFM